MSELADDRPRVRGDAQSDVPVPPDPPDCRVCGDADACDACRPVEPALAEDKPKAPEMDDLSKQVTETFRKRRHLKTVFLFLLAYWLYIDGVDTIIRMAVDYGLSLGFASSDLILALLITQFVGFPSALLFGRLGERWDVRKAIFLAIGVYMFITVWGILMTEKSEFYVLAILIGTVQGGIQALSRSYYSRLIPKAQAGEFYGFYNMLGKFAAILGPALVGLVGIIAKGRLMPMAPSPEQIAAVEQAASRWSIGSLLILFLVGGTLLYFVDEEKGRREIANWGRP